MFLYKNMDLLWINTKLNFEKVITYYGDATEKYFNLTNRHQGRLH